MAAGYKVRLGDGSEIGPMDLESVRAWYTQGLIEKDSPVLKPGSSQWTRVSELLKGAELRGVQAPPSRAEARREVDEEEEFRPYRPWNIRAAGVFFMLASVGALLFWLLPAHVLPAFEAAPFREIGLGLLLCGLALIPGWGITRKLVRGVTLLAAIALFPLAGILFANGARGPALLVLGSTFALCLAFLGLLAPEPPLLSSILSLVLLIASGAGIGYYGWAQVGPESAQVRDWSSPDRRFADAEADVTFEVPTGWVILRKEQTVVPAPSGTRLVLAEPNRGGFAYLTLDRSANPAQTEDQRLDTFLTFHRQATANLREVSRTDFSVGGLPARGSKGVFESGGSQFQDLSVVWRNGWTGLGFAAWVKEDPSAEGALETLFRGISSSGGLSVRLRSAVATAIREVPHLTPSSVEILMGRSAAQVLEPQEVFRRSYEWASRGVSSLTSNEAREMGELNGQVFAALPTKDRGRLASYFEKVKGRRPTSADEDRMMGQLMRSGVLQLPAARLSRLQALYEKAIRAAAEQSTA